MGKREITTASLLGLMALAGSAIVAGYSMTPNGFTPALLLFGWCGLIVGVGGLIYMFRTAPKAAVAAAQEALLGPVREFLDPEITPAVLRQKLANKTNVQVDVLSKTYLGKWMRVEGRVANVSSILTDKALASSASP